jgi:hypothetical protein
MNDYRTPADFAVRHDLPPFHHGRNHSVAIAGQAPPPGVAARYDFLLLEEDFLLLADDFLLGTLAPAFRASESPIAIACLRLLTFFPDRPFFNVPAFRSCIAFLTLLCAFLP